MSKNNGLTIASKKYAGGSSVISARIPMNLLEKIDKICEKTGRKRNEIITMCLDYAIDNIVVTEGNE